LTKYLQISGQGAEATFGVRGRTRLAVHDLLASGLPPAAADSAGAEPI
jgi:hypothetical protein